MVVETDDVSPNDPQGAARKVWSATEIESPMTRLSASSHERCCNRIHPGSARRLHHDRLGAIDDAPFRAVHDDATAKSAVERRKVEMRLKSDSQGCVP